MKKAITLFMLSILIFDINFAQKNQQGISVNDLKLELASTEQDSTRVLILAQLCSIYNGFDTDSALMYGHQALKLARRSKFIKGEVLALSRLTVTFRLIGDVPEALRLIFRGIQIAEANGLQYEKVYCLIQEANTYRDGLNDYNKAFESYYNARRLINSFSPTEDNKLLKFRFDRSIGIAHMNYNQYDSALFYLQKAYNSQLQQGNFPWITLMLLGKLQFKMGNYKLALKYLRKSILYNAQYVKQPRAFSEAYNMYAGILKEMNQPDSVIFYASKGLEEAQLIDYKQEVLESCNLLADVYEVVDVKEANKYLKMAKVVNEELYGAERVRQLQKIISKEQERQSQIENENLVFKNRVQRLWIFSISGALISAMILALILYRNIKNKQKANAMLNAQKEEIQSTLEKLKSTQSQLIQSEKMASLGELTAGIAHEIQNPLNFVNNFSEVNDELIEELREAMANNDQKEIQAILDDLKENESKIKHHGQRAEGIVKGMLEHSRTSDGKKELTDINGLADEYLRLAYHGLRAKDKSFNADFKTEFDPDLPKINVVPQDIGRVLLNLINNAFYAVNEKNKTLRSAQSDESSDYTPEVIVTTKATPLPGGAGGGFESVQISVSDNGPGIPEQVREKIFQPFFTTKPTGSGTGLGLSLSYDIVNAHGGELKFESVPGEGTVFIIHLPIHP